jgi:hypothetical protein
VYCVSPYRRCFHHKWLHGDRGPVTERMQNEMAIKIQVRRVVCCCKVVDAVTPCATPRCVAATVATTARSQGLYPRRGADLRESSRSVDGRVLLFRSVCVGRCGPLALVGVVLGGSRTVSLAGPRRCNRHARVCTAAAARARARGRSRRCWATKTCLKRFTSRSGSGLIVIERALFTGELAKRYDAVVASVSSSHTIVTSCSGMRRST